MMTQRTKQWILLGLMLLSASLGAALKPTIFLSDELPAVHLDSMLPKAFGEWQELPVTLTQIVNPQQQETLEKIYSETLSRVYVNREGYGVMLSVAYGNVIGLCIEAIKELSAKVTALEGAAA